MKNKRFFTVLACFVTSILLAFGLMGCAANAQTEQPKTETAYLTGMQMTLKVVSEDVSLAQYQLDIFVSANRLASMQVTSGDFLRYLSDLSSAEPDFGMISYLETQSGLSVSCMVLTTIPQAFERWHIVKNDGFFACVYEVRLENPLDVYKWRMTNYSKNALLTSNHAIDRLMGIVKYGNGALSSATTYLGTEIASCSMRYGVPKKMGMHLVTGQDGADGYFYYGYADKVRYTRLQFKSFACYGLIVLIGVALAAVLLILARKSKAKPTLVDTSEKEKRRIMLTKRAQPMPPQMAMQMQADVQATVKENSYEEIFGEQNDTPSSEQNDQDENN